MVPKVSALFYPLVAFPNMQLHDDRPANRQDKDGDLEMLEMGSNDLNKNLEARASSPTGNPSNGEDSNDLNKTSESSPTESSPEEGPEEPHVENKDKEAPSNADENKEEDDQSEEKLASSSAEAK